MRAAARAVRLGGHDPRATVYVSDQAHASIGRALRVLGFAADRVRTLATGRDLRLSPARLDQAVSDDRRAGLLPFCVIATAGSTNTGAVDPLPELADLCAREDLWLHADAAYGGPAVLCERGRAALAGIELVDSLVIDPHKWLFQPYEAGCVLVRHPGALARAFALHPEYLADVMSRDDEVNFFDRGIQLTRGCRALKLWMTIKVYGLAAIRRAVAHGIALAEHAEAELRARGGWEIVTPAQLRDRELQARGLQRQREPGVGRPALGGRVRRRELDDAPRTSRAPALHDQSAHDLRGHHADT
jgi:aromatic-L-amino-acid/L-tryptophan decarboxylase